MPPAKRLLILTRDRTNAAFRQRIEPYLPALAARGIAAEVVELDEDPWARRRQWHSAARYDGVLIHRKTLSWWDARTLGRPPHVLYDFDDAVMFQARSPSEPHAGRLRRFERTIHRAAAVIAGNPTLADHARRADARRVEVLPTGLDVRLFPPRTTYTTSDPLRLVWIGSRSTLKQLEPLRPMLEALGRALPGTSLRIIADAALHVQGLSVENVPWSLADEGRLLAEADIGIAPLPDTPFTRGKCGFKVLQYMAAGLPVVTSPVGVNADYVRPGESGFHAATTDEWLSAVRQLADDTALRERLGCAGRVRVEKEFDFAVLAPRFCEVVERAMTP